MKTKTILLIIVTSLMIMTGCEPISEGPFIKKSVTPPSMLAPGEGTSYVITEATENDVMAEFTWNGTDYGYNAAVTYTLQITITSDFKDANDIGNTHETSLEITNSTMNSTLLILGAEPTVEREVLCRIKSVISPDVATVYSDTVAINVTPFEKIIIYPKLYVPGNYQSPNAWDPTNENTVISSVKSDGKYEGFLYFGTADPIEFKMLKGPAWVQADCVADAQSSGTSGTLVVGDWGNNIKATGAPGYFRLKANLNDAIYEWVKTDWGLIGSATPGGWGSDQNLTYDPVEDVWTLTVDLVVGEIKFRANDDWAINFGDDGGDKKLEYGGSNIQITAAGNYTIKLDLGNPVYKYYITKN